MRVGTVRCGGGFADVSDGEYSGRSVAIKRLRMSEVNSNRAFKVPLINLVRHRRSSYPVFMSRGHRLETLVPSKHLASVGRFCVCRLALPLHRHWLDAQWERGAVHKVRSRSKPPTIGEITCHSLDLPLIHPFLLAFRGHGGRNLSPRTQDCSWRSQRGECSSLGPPLISLTSKAKKHPRWWCRCRSCGGFRTHDYDRSQHCRSI